MAKKKGRKKPDAKEQSSSLEGSNAVQRSTTQPSFGHMDFPALGAPTPVPSPISRPVPSPVAIPVPSTVSSPVSRPVPSTIPSSVPSTVQIKNEPVANPNSSTGAVPKQATKSKPDSTLSDLTPDLSRMKITDKSKLEWDRSCQGTVQNPYQNIETRKKNVGKAGRKIQLLTNHFDVALKLDIVNIYEINFVFPWKNIRKKDKPLHYRCFEEVKKKEFPLPFNTYAIIFDGMNTIFSAKKLKLDKPISGHFDIVEDPNIDRNRTVPVKYTLKKRSEGPDWLDVKSSIDLFEQGMRKYGNRARALFEAQPQEALQVLNIILSYSANLNPKFVNLGRRFFQPDTTGRVQQIGGGKYLWLGSFESIRVGWKLRLNVDMANKPAYEKGPLVEYLLRFLNAKNMNQIFANSYFREGAEKEIKDLKARFKRPDNKFRKYRMLKFVNNPRNQLMTLENGKKLSIMDYFNKEYNYQIKNPDWPLIHCGDPKRTIYLPIELLDLERQVCPQSKILGDDSTRNMIKITAVKPHERFEKIRQNLQEQNEAFKNDPYAKEFGISVNDHPLKVGARVLDPPSLLYYEKGSNRVKEQGKSTVFYKKENNNCPGKWDPPRNSQFKTCKSLKKWLVMDTANVRENEWNLFLNMLYKEAQNLGVVIDFPKFISCSTNELEDKLRSYKENNTDMDLAMVIMEFKNSDVYARVKLLGDTELKVPTQFVLQKNISKRQRDGTFSPDRSTIHNIILKLNSKLGGTNQTLEAAPTSKVIGPIFERPVMVMGADVTHPAPDQMGLKPSIAAVVASYDPGVSKYFSEIRTQYKELSTTNVVEEILSMEEVTKKLLMKFFKTSGHKPQKIIFYRDGVSEGQFEMVLNKEVSAIQRACLSLEENYQPGITYIVAQKRHHTRFYPEQKQDQLRNGNVLPGTCVDTDITHPTVSSYYLASHEGIQGTTKPTYYVKLYDDNNLTADQEQALTYYLCHLYSRCERSVSYPQPTYYAHLAAFRARDHHNALLQKYDMDSTRIPKSEVDKMQNLDLTNYFI